MKHAHLFLFLLIALSTIGCGSVKATGGSLVAGNFQYPAIASKDYETLGLVFSEIEIDEDMRSSSKDGLTYFQLLKEAQKLNADAIINVTVEELTHCEQSGRSRRCRLTRYGSALAIRYTKTLTVDQLAISSNTDLKINQNAYISDKNVGITAAH